jgi:hypothetical protein
MSPLLAFAFLAIWFAGCASPGTDSPADASRVRLLYQSQGTLVAVTAVGPVGREQLFLWEGFRAEDEFMEPRGVLRAVTLDPATGQATVSWERAYSETPWGWSEGGIAVSQDRRRFAHFQFDPMAEGSGVWAADVGGEWTPVIPLDSRFRLLLQWSPHGDVLTYVAMDFGPSGPGDRDAIALPVPRPPKASTEIALTPDGHLATEVAWAPDSRRVYALSFEPGVGDYLEVVDWPSLERRRVFDGAGLGQLSVARESGEVVFLAREKSEAEQAGDDVSARRVWRLSPEGEVEKTAVTHTGAMPSHAISPDGSHLAVVPGAEEERFYGQGLTVYSLHDGTAETFAEFEGKRLLHVDWVLGGRAVLAVDGVDGLWLATVKGERPKTATVELDPPDISSFPPNPEQHSRNNLRRLSDALLTYAFEHDCKFPDLGDRAAVSAALAPYLEDQDVFLDPRTGEPYGANPSFSGKCNVDFDDQENFVLFYETTPGEDGGRNVAVLPSAVHHVSDDRWQKMKKVSGLE